MSPLRWRHLLLLRPRRVWKQLSPISTPLNRGLGGMYFNHAVVCTTTDPAIRSAPSVDPVALAASTVPADSSSTPGTAPVPPSLNTRSLSRQTSTSFRAAAAVANAPAPPARGRQPAQPTAPTLAPQGSSPSTADAYFHLGMTPAPSVSETAGAAHTRHNDNEVAIVNTIRRLEHIQQSQDHIARERHEELTLMLNGARLTAAEDSRKLREVQHGDHAALSELVGAVNNLRRDVAGFRPGNSAASAVAPLPALVNPGPASSSPQRSGATFGPPASEATSSRVRHDPPPADDETSPAKRQRTQEGEHHDVLFYEVATTGEPRDIARAACMAIPNLTAGSFLNAIRGRGRAATISIRFRTRPLALTFIDAIQNCPPPNFDGLHACWTPAAADPIAIIRGEGYIARSTG
jgi:hypothetical protein